MATATSAELAKWLGISDRAVRDAAKAGHVIREGRNAYDLEASVRAYCANLREQAAGRLGRDDELDPVRENALLKRSQRELNEIRKSEAEGRLIPLEAIEPAWARVATATRAAVLGVPGRLRFRLPHLTAHDGKVAEEICRDALEAAAMSLAPPGADATEAAETAGDEDDAGVN